MNQSSNDGSPADPCDARFGNTRWTQILRAADRDGSGFEEALQQLCQTYWYPIYAFVRRMTPRI